MEPWFLLSFLEFTEDLHSVEKQTPFSCPLTLDYLMAKTSLAKNQGSEKFQLKSLGLTAFFFSFSKKQKTMPLSDNINAFCWLEGCCGKPWLNYRIKSCFCASARLLLTSWYLFLAMAPYSHWKYHWYFWCLQAEGMKAWWVEKYQNKRGSKSSFN